MTKNSIPWTVCSGTAALFETGGTVAILTFFREDRSRQKIVSCGFKDGLYSEIAIRVMPRARKSVGMIAGEFVELYILRGWEIGL